MIKKVKKSVPDLRFPDFKGDWENKNFGEFVSRVKTKYNPSIDEKNYYCIELESIVSDQGQLIKLFNSKEQQSIKNKFNTGDVLFGKLRPNLRKFILTEFEGVCSSEIWVLRGKNILNEYLYYLIQTNKFYKISNVTFGSKMPRADWDFITSFPFQYPKTEEQEKIAKFLGECDRKLNLLRRKKELLETYKRGVMQKIFSQQIRFKNDDGSNFPDWEKKKLRNLCSLIKDGTHGTHQDYSEGQYFLLSAKNITNGQILYDENDRRISQKEFESIYKNYQLKKNDILLTIVGTIGRLALFNDAKNLAFQRSVAFFRFKESLPMFMYHQMTNIKFQRELLKRKVVSAQPGIYLGDLSNIKLYSPLLKEQEKIAEFLIAIDKKIEAVRQQIEGMEKFKQGLLQKMFV